MFRIGQKVVYVGSDLFRDDGRDFPTNLEIGQVCTVRDVDTRYIPPFGYVGIRVEEEIDGLVPWNGTLIEPAFLSICFRHVVERKTDTGFSILEEIRKRESVPDTERVRKPVTAGKHRG